MECAQDKLNEYFDKISIPKCPLCGSSKWSVTGKVFQLPEFNPEQSDNTQVVYPVIPISCNSCGNVILISAIRAGIVSKEKSDGKKDE